MSKLISLGTQALKNSKPHIQHFWYYAKVELAPPKLSELSAVPVGIAKLIGSFKSGVWKTVTVKQAVVNSMITAEVIGWFFIGECIGKRHFIGYKVR